jgi:hypothetical protein
MKVNFLFMDESYGRRSKCSDSKTNIASLTGLLVPIEKFSVVQKEFYELLGWCIKPEHNAVNFLIPELHGKDFLPDESDDRKHEFSGVLYPLLLEMN